MASSSYLMNFPGLEYLMVVPKDLRAQVAHWCGMSPTLDELRRVMRSYGRLSDEIARVVVTSPFGVELIQNPSAMWADYWSNMLLGDLVKTDECEAELQRRLGVPSLAKPTWKPDYMRPTFVENDEPEEQDLAGFSFSQVYVDDQVCETIPGEIAEKLVEDEGAQLSDVDPVATGYFLDAPECAGPVVENAGKVMHKYHLWADVGCKGFDRFSAMKGFCYLKLFDPNMRDTLALALGELPTSKAVAAVYFAGLIFGFAAKSGLGVDERDGVIHLKPGEWSYGRMLQSLLASESRVGQEIHDVQLISWGTRADDTVLLKEGRNLIPVCPGRPASIMVPPDPSMYVCKLDKRCYLKQKADLRIGSENRHTYVRVEQSNVFQVVSSATDGVFEVDVEKLQGPSRSLSTQSHFAYDSADLVIVSAYHPGTGTKEFSVVETSFPGSEDDSDWAPVQKQKLELKLLPQEQTEVVLDMWQVALLGDFEHDKYSIKVGRAYCSYPTADTELCVLPKLGKIRIMFRSRVDCEHLITFSVTSVNNEYAYDSGGPSDFEEDCPPPQYPVLM